MYHGTKIKQGQEIIKSQSMKSSRGDDHWLGDGIYFYTEEVYAFRWIAIKYSNNFKNEHSEEFLNIFNEYTILKATVEVDEERIFSLNESETYLFFLYISDLLKRKKRYSSKFRNIKIVDGVVLNILFEDLGYKKKYDLVEATFPIKQNNKNLKFTRLEYIPETQICIKNANVIIKIEKYNKKEVPERYKEFIKRYNRLKFGHDTFEQIFSNTSVLYKNNRKK